MEIIVLRGSTFDFGQAVFAGDGDGYGYGDGDGDGYGYGSGDGYGSGSGSGAGYGDGYGAGAGAGYGYGDGDGYGSGSGSGAGAGYGSGSGSGAGAGAGYGYGDGDGYGYGSGDGYGYGSGSGDGYGAESLPIWQALCRSEMSRYSPDVTLAFWKSNEKGGPANGGKENFVAEPGLVQSVEGPLKLCGSRALHATLTPSQWNGERLWLVALHGDVAVESSKLGGLTREIIREIPLEKNTKGGDTNGQEGEQAQ